jgi:hypothetical protein
MVRFTLRISTSSNAAVSMAQMRSASARVWFTDSLPPVSGCSTVLLMQMAPMFGIRQRLVQPDSAMALNDDLWRFPRRVRRNAVVHFSLMAPPAA